jgi:hypothetical protein
MPAQTRIRTLIYDFKARKLVYETAGVKIPDLRKIK